MQNQIEGRQRESGSDVATRLTYLLIGGSIGAMVALLFAPKSGQELRGDIADATRKGIDRTRETATQVGTRAGELAGTARERASELYNAASEKTGGLAGTAREVAARKGGHLSAAIEAGKQAYADEKRRTVLSSATNAAPTYYEREKEG
jgi:gas vesicle protein